MKKILFIILVCILVSMCSCKNDEGQKIDNKKETFQNKNEWINKKIDENLVANFKVETPIKEKMDLYEGEYISLSVEKVKNIFFKNDNSKYKIESEQDPNNKDFGYTEYLTSENGTEMYSNKSNVGGETTAYKYYGNFLGRDIEAYDENGNPDKLGSDEEFDFLPKASVEKEIYEGIKKLGLDFSINKLHFYSLTSSYLNDLQKQSISNINDDNIDVMDYDEKYLKSWKKNEGAYYVVVELNIDKTSLNNKYFYVMSDGKTINRTYMNLIYNKDGCVYLYMPDIIKITNENKKDIISAEQALKALTEDLTSIILTNRNTISSAKLKYAVIGTGSNMKVEIVPIWFFEVQSSYINKKNGKEDIQTDIYCINANTGQVLH